MSDPEETAAKPTLDERVDEFTRDYHALMVKHFGEDAQQWEPLAMRLRERYPQADVGAAQVTTTVTGTWNGKFDSDPPDQD